MKNKIARFITVVMTTLITCFFISMWFYQPNIKFNKKEWIKNNDFEIKDNPRRKMVTNLTKNILKRKMSKSEVESILGETKKEIITKLKYEAIKPDSIKVGDKNYYKWYTENCKEITVIKYILGATLGDYKFLVIQIDENDYVVDYWVKQR